MVPWSSPMSTEIQPGRYRLVAVDLDSTLQPSGALHPADAAALRTAHAAGVKIALVSALPPQSMHRYWAQLGLGTPVIALNGALVFDYPGQKPVVGQALGGATLRLILQSVQQVAPRASVGLQHGDTWSISHLGSAARAIIQRTGVWPASIGDLAGRLSESIYQVWVDAEPDQFRALESALAHAGLGMAYYSDPAILVLQAAAASRGWALSTLASILEVPPDQVMAVGDGGRDRSMLQAAAFAVLVAGIGQEPEPNTDAGFLAHTPGVAEALARYLTVEGSEAQPWPAVEP